MNLRRFTCITAATVASSVLIFGTSSPVHSQPVMIYGQLDTETQRVVQYGDLNLVNPTGQNRLFRRVGYAVDDLCGGNRSLAAVRENLEVRSCSKAAWSSANPQIAAAVDQAKSGNYISAAALTITSVR